jgi:hypothetical protein
MVVNTSFSVILAIRHLNESSRNVINLGTVAGCGAFTMGTLNDRLVWGNGCATRVSAFVVPRQRWLVQSFRVRPDGTWTLRIGTNVVDAGHVSELGGGLSVGESLKASACCPVSPRAEG